ncbi:hypothetical protein BSKO_11484 [Bryopsis sp. KO-2023]|nr:hypothetical protein BSKO_11484 [Bryopsis sp. KO-2023]
MAAAASSTCDNTVQDLVVIGAGPHALTFACALLEEKPMERKLVDAEGGITRSRLGERDMRKRILDRQKKPSELPKGLERTMFVDRFGGWMTNWNHQFKFLGIPQLRSTGGIHPDPVDPEILFEFARMKGLSMEEGFVEITGVPRNKFFRGPFQTPKTELFESFCEFLIGAYGLKDLVHQGEVLRVEPLQKEGKFGSLFAVCLKNGEIIQSRRVVVSLGHTNVKRFPDWVDFDQCPPNRVVHVWDLVHMNPDKTNIKDENLMIVGGGLTSVQLVDISLQMGARHVYWLARSGVKVRQFDSDLLWTGRLRHEKLKSFWGEDSMSKRLDMIMDARQGGTIPHESKNRLDELVEEGRCTVLEYAEVWDANWSNEEEAFDMYLSSGLRLSVGRVWLATGSDIDISEEPLFSNLMESHPLETQSGYPVLQPDLRWAPEWDLFVMGAYSALSMGPDAINLAGARRAGFKIADCIKASLQT